MLSSSNLAKTRFQPGFSPSFKFVQPLDDVTPRAMGKQQLPSCGNAGFRNPFFIQLLFFHMTDMCNMGAAVMIGCGKEESCCCYLSKEQLPLLFEFGTRGHNGDWPFNFSDYTKIRKQENLSANVEQLIKC